MKMGDNGSLLIGAEHKGLIVNGYRTVKMGDNRSLLIGAKKWNTNHSH